MGKDQPCSCITAKLVPVPVLVQCCQSEWVQRCAVAARKPSEWDGLVCVAGQAAARGSHD